MIPAIVLGVIVGVVGFLPLFGGLQLTKRVTSTSNLGYAGALLLSVFVSFIILVGAMIICAVVARDVILPFVLAEVAGLVLSAIGFGIYKVLLRK